MFDPNHIGPRDTSIANELAKFLDDGEPKPSLKDNIRHVIQVMSALKLAISGYFRAFGQRIQRTPRQNPNITNSFVVDDRIK